MESGAGGEFGLGDELAEILVTGARGGEERDDGAVFHRDLGADARADGEIVFVGAAIKAGRAVHAVAVEEGDGGELGGERGFDQVFGKGRATEKTEGAAGVEFDVRHWKNLSRKRGKAEARNGMG